MAHYNLLIITDLKFEIDEEKIQNNVISQSNKFEYVNIYIEIQSYGHISVFKF